MVYEFNDLDNYKAVWLQAEKNCGQKISLCMNGMRFALKSVQCASLAKNNVDLCITG